MSGRFERIFEGLPLCEPTADGHVLYSVAAVPEGSSYFVGKDNEGKASLLISGSPDARQRAPIRLENLEAQFNKRSLVRSHGSVTDGIFTIVQCRSSDPQIWRFFLSVAETVTSLLGSNSSDEAIAQVINRFAIIFRRLENPSARSLHGLFGELFVIHESNSPLVSVRAWRLDDASRFDFTLGDIRLDAKTTIGRLRLHTLSYDQCNPPSSTLALVASMFVEQAANGSTLTSLIEDIEPELAADPELVLKLHDNVAATLGMTLSQGLATKFDVALARSSLCFFDLRRVPAIRGELPVGVGDVHFRSDLSGLRPESARLLKQSYPSIANLLPRVER